MTHRSHTPGKELSSRSCARRKARGHQPGPAHSKFKSRNARTAAIAWAGLSWLALAAGCSGEDDGVTYAQDIQPLFEDRCTLCHRPGAPAGPAPSIAIDILNAYAPEVGLATSKNLWKEAYPEVASPVYTVMPGQPEESFLMQKISDPALGLLPAENAGSPMPQQFEPLTEDEKASIDSWVLEGAEDTASYRAQVRPIFGTRPGTGKCIYCHYEGTPYPPDLTQPFGPDGVVNIASVYRPDMLRVSPGAPDQSLLVMKIRAEQPTSEFGASMPRSFPPLSPREVDRVRQWILEGARP
jgi:hypothetical protein